MESYKEIIQLLKAQNPSGLEKLYQEYGKPFYSYCIQKWNFSEDEAWEVVYKTLETLVLKIVNYDIVAQSDFDRFVYRVLINFLRQQYRTKKHQQSNKIVYVDFNSDDNAINNFSTYLNNTALESYFSQESAENPELLRLKGALDMLESTDRDLLLLRAQNYAYEEIAILIGIDNSQLKVKHFRAKKKLLEILNEQSKS